MTLRKLPPATTRPTTPAAPARNDPPRRTLTPPNVPARLRSDAFDAGAPKRRSTDVVTLKRLPEAILQSMMPAEARKFTAVEAGEEGRFARDSADRLTGTDAFARLDASTQTQLLRTFLKAPAAPISNGLLATLSNSDGFAELNSAQRAQALEIFRSSDMRGQRRLIELANRDVDGAPALLDLDSEGRTLLSRLHAIAEGPLSRDVMNSGVKPEELLGTLLEECAEPGEVNQGSKNTCTVTSMQYLLCEQNPAEYARLMEGLITGDGRVRMKSGATLTVERDAIADDGVSHRSPTERIFQASMMEYSNGGESYSNETDRSTGRRALFFDYSHTGLNARAQERGLEALFGRGFRGDGSDLVELLSERSPTDTYVRMKWGEDKEAGHAVVVTRVESGRVYFRNPWGPTSDPVGTQYSEPPRRLENRDNREESMSVEDFERWAKGALV